MTQEAIVFMAWAAGFAVYGTFAWRRAVVRRREAWTLMTEAATNLDAAKANLAQADLRLDSAKVLLAKNAELHADISKLLTPARSAGTSDTR